MKTMQGWEASKLPLSKFLEVGDEVSEEIYDYFINVLPPVTMNFFCVQIGEPYDSDENGFDRFMTICKYIVDGKWYYAGLRTRGWGRNYNGSKDL